VRRARNHQAKPSCLVSRLQSSAETTPS
jgi:hypothetical protein